MLYPKISRSVRAVVSVAFIFILGFQAYAGNADSAKKDRAKVVMIDLRDTTDYSIDHVNGALNISPDNLEDAVNTRKEFQDKNVRIKLYSDDESSITSAKDTFERLGFYNVESLGSLEDAKVRVNDVKATKALRREEAK